MASYRIVITKSAQKGIRKLPKSVIRRVDSGIRKLKSNPRPMGCEKLTGSKSSYRIRIGVYRVIYTVYDKELVIVVVKAEHRKDAYKGL